MIITAKFASTCSCCRAPISVGSRIETEEHRRQYAAERASEDYYEAWAEAAGDWATRSELIDAWLVNHPEAVVGAWMCA